jgi:ferredoxin-NADP reductase
MSMNIDMTLDVHVVHHRPLAVGVHHLVLQAPDGRELPAWSPGAHIDVFSPSGLLRQYSLCGHPEQRDRYEIAVLDATDSRGGSRSICHDLTSGSLLRIGFPRQLFPLQPSPRYLFIAGGIGITPLLPMLRHATAQGAEWQLLYGGRNRRTMAFTEELIRDFGARVHIAPEDEAGLLPLDDWLGIPTSDMLVYACGPEPMLQAVEDRCRVWPKGALHVERFSSKPQPTSEDTTFDVVLQRTGVTLTIPPGTSILDAVEAAGVSCLSACGQGTCGTCWTKVLDGVPDHRDALLDEDQKSAGDQMLICVSRALTKRLILDI